MSAPSHYPDYPLVEATLDSRLVLGFSVPGKQLRRRVRPPLVVGCSSALVLHGGVS
jgi:hypothetical protein